MNGLADRWIEGKEWDHLGPCPTPGGGDGRVFPNRFFFKCVEFGCGRIGGSGPVNPAQIGCHHPEASHCPPLVVWKAPAPGVAMRHEGGVV